MKPLTLRHETMQSGSQHKTRRHSDRRAKQPWLLYILVICVVAVVAGLFYLMSAPIQPGAH